MIVHLLCLASVKRKKVQGKPARGDTVAKRFCTLSWRISVKVCLLLGLLANLLGTCLNKKLGSGKAR